jgi:hypothetical protein
MLGVYALYIYFTSELTGEYNLYADIFNWRIATGRLQQAVDYLSNNRIRLLASRFPDDGTLFDCGFFRVFYEAGYLWAGLFFIAFFALVIISLRKNWDAIIPVCVYFVFCSLYEFEPATRPTFNIVAFFLPLLLYKDLAKHNKPTLFGH